jgi:hypothetical protein
MEVDGGRGLKQIWGMNFFFKEIKVKIFILYIAISTKIFSF